MHIKNQRGDTLIEVLLAITIFSAAAVGAIYIMNRGISTEMQALELTQVRNQINNQAELIRHLNNLAITASGRVTAGGTGSLEDSAIAAQWRKMTSRSISEAPSFNSIQTLEDCQPAKIATADDEPFFVNTFTGDVVELSPTSVDTTFKAPETFAKINTPDPSAPSVQESYMLWVYSVKKDNTSEGRTALGGDFYDFHIRACWENPSDGGVQKTGTIVRLYEPK